MKVPQTGSEALANLPGLRAILKRPYAISKNPVSREEVERAVKDIEIVPLGGVAGGGFYQGGSNFLIYSNNGIVGRVSFGAHEADSNEVDGVGFHGVKYGLKVCLTQGRGPGRNNDKVSFRYQFTEPRGRVDGWEDINFP